MRDPNPIYDPGSPISTAGIHSAARLCDLLEVDLTVLPPKGNVTHG